MRIMLDNYLKELPLIAILRGITPAEVIAVADVLTGEGIGIIEVPLNSPRPCESIELLAQHYRNDVLIGAGTVLDVSDISAVREAGGMLIVSPNTDVDVIHETKKLNMTSIPGACTPTEVLTAMRAGADAIKMFPAEVVSPAAVKAIRAVIPPRFCLLAVGGINIENMPEYIQKGINGFGIGSAIYRKGKSLSDIRQDAGAVISAYRQNGVKS